MRITTLVATACLFAIGCVVGLSVGRARRRKIRFGLFHKPKRTSLAVLVPPGPAPRLIPSASPNAARARYSASARRQTRIAATRGGVIDYLAPFAGSEGSAGETRVDYLLPPDEDAVASCEDSEDIPAVAPTQPPAQ